MLPAALGFVVSVTKESTERVLVITRERWDSSRRGRLLDRFLGVAGAVGGGLSVEEDRVVQNEDSTIIVLVVQ